MNICVIKWVNVCCQWFVGGVGGQSLKVLFEVVFQYDYGRG